MIVIRKKGTQLYLNGKHYWDVRWGTLEEARVYTTRATAGRSAGAILKESYGYRTEPFEFEFVQLEFKVMGVVK